MFTAAEGATIAQPIGDSFILGCRGRNVWRNQYERQFYCRRPRAQPMAQPIGDSFSLGG